MLLTVNRGVLISVTLSMPYITIPDCGDSVKLVGLGAVQVPATSIITMCAATAMLCVSQCSKEFWI